jgi:hypothetical protein
MVQQQPIGDVTEEWSPWLGESGNRFAISKTFRTGFES